MKSRLILFLLMTFIFASNNKDLYSQEMKDGIVQKPSFSDQSTWVLGYFVRGQITSPPHSEWFIKEYDDYEINPEVLNRILKIPPEGLSIKIILGTWCPDSRKQVPRFMKITDTWRFPEKDILFIGVDDAKISPVGEYIQLNIERVPTFIFYRNNIEAGRIIENPLTSLEQDIVNILTGKE